MTEPLISTRMVEAILDMQEIIYRQNKRVGWWDDCKVDEKVPEKLMLIVSEISEAMEGHRKDLMDDHLPQREMIEVELADAVIRIFDLAEALELDVGTALQEKVEYNRTRADHKRENREKQGGKRY